MLVMLLAGQLYAQDIAGAWYGVLAAPGRNLHVVFHIARSGDGYTSTLDSPDQGANGLATDATTLQKNQLTIVAPRFGIKYTGTFVPDSGLIKGVLIQGGEIPLNLSRNRASAQPVSMLPRPQDPKDFPYKREEIVFTNLKGGNQLAGTLTLPADGKCTKIVILITGSGPQNRDEEVTAFNHRPFLVWSDQLTRQGIAVLRYDDRGVGKSTGNFATATSADFADDAEAAVNYILSRPDLSKLRIGLMGHSEGGLIAPMVAARNKAVKFVCLLAGPGQPMTELLLQQERDQLRLAGASQQAIELSMRTNRKVMDLVTGNSTLSTAQLKEKIDTLLYRELRAYPAGALQGESIDAAVKRGDSQVTTPWFRYMLGIHPDVYLSKVTCPVLALNGTLDMQVQCSANLAGIKAALQKGGNKNHQEVALPGLNHLFQKAQTGALGEYAQISETVNPVALQKVSAWINEL